MSGAIPLAQARRQARQPPAPPTPPPPGQFITDRDDKPRPILANAIKAIQSGAGAALVYDEFAMAATLCGPAPWQAEEVTEARELTDADDIACADWLQREFSIFVGPEISAQALQHVARKSSFHPVKRYLDALQWDGVQRLDTWLTYFLGAKDEAYERHVGAKWLISAVARIYEPGCKADCALILEGRQGLLKSSAMAVLGGAWFTDELDDMGSKDAALQTRGVWIIELAELESLQRSSIEKVKAFMSRRCDRFRPPYGRRLINSPRQCVFVGSVNDSAYLRDDTGARRFWPVACTSVDLEALKVDRDQLWAEAVARYRSGASWWLDDPDIVKAAEDEQQHRFLADAWEDRIAYYLTGVQETSVGLVLEQAIGLAAGQWTRSHEMRVASIFKTLGWAKVRSRSGTERKNRYRKQGCDLKLCR